MNRFVFGVAQIRWVRAARGCSLALVAVIALGFAQGVQSREAAIASAHPLATQAGLQVLEQGGNAFDAAVAVAAVLAVVEPYSSGLGGGGFFLLHRASDGFEVMLDARETAPGSATRELYIGADGKPDTKASLEGAKAAGIPGTPAGLAWLAEKYARLPLAQSLKPAIRYAREGFPVDGRYVTAAGFREAMLKSNAQVAQQFLHDGKIPPVGHVVRQPELAATLELLAREGHQGFYAGDVAQHMVRAVQANGGIWEMADLAAYQVIEREPMRFTYRGARITCAALPSSGGLVLAQSLQILERYALHDLEPVQRAHFVSEALRRGYQDRSRYLGDPAFAAVPDWLATRAYAERRAATIDPIRATPSSTLDALASAAREGDNTTHFSVVDRDGNRVAATLSINLPFGAGMLAGDTGVLLNNEMNDFAIASDTPNAYRLTGGEANAIAPGKRPLSSMTPTFVEDQRGVLVFGTPGGSRIISMVLLGILEYLDSGDAERVVALPRYHHQYLPDRIEYEPGDGFSAQWIEALLAMGHSVQEGRRRWGNMQAVFIDRRTGAASAHNDPRGKGGNLF